MQVLDSEQERLLTAATVLFERFGYRKTTIEDIAQEAGIGKGTVYLRFASKADLGVAWGLSLQEKIWQALMESVRGASADRIVAFLTTRVMVRYDLFTRFRRSFEEGFDQLAPRVQENIAAFLEREAQFIKGQIKEGNEAGVFHSLDPLADARLMVLATNSLVFYRRRPEEVPDRETVHLQAEALARLLVRAIERTHA
ncbi:MAG: TetR/AcrR family transcriptional regulator [Fimbriimonadaceae bacterium]|nr:TetR/AcrR family transcriptional regulator [Fimbriimonadaceae bacterium]